MYTQPLIILAQLDLACFPGNHFKGCFERDGINKKKNLIMIYLCYIVILSDLFAKTFPEPLDQFFFYTQNYLLSSTKSN